MPGLLFKTPEVMVIDSEENHQHQRHRVKPHKAPAVGNVTKQVNPKKVKWDNEPKPG
jgi:hypothetical protein